MKLVKHISGLIILSCLLCCCNNPTETNDQMQRRSDFQHFISADGPYLMDGADTLRFVSWNIPNLNYVEDNMTFESNNPYDLPDEFEIRNALETIKEMGGQVVRMYTLPVRSKHLPADAVTYVEGPGQFNEEAFVALDQVMALANEIGIRVIIPFVNNWKWMGGAPDYAAFRGKTFADFWIDEQLWNDFQLTVDHLLHRTNTITGTKYINDKAIFCWESGNELENPYPWVKRLAEHVKGIDTNHLFMDGFFALDDTPFYPEVFDDANIDIITSHHYEGDPIAMHQNIVNKVEIIDGRKPYFVGEFGFVSTSGMKMVLDYIVQEPTIFGAMSWSIRHHHKKGGFYWHSEPHGFNLYKAFHWPGFSSGDDYDESSLLKLFRDAAFEIQNEDIPPVSIPDPPTFLPMGKTNLIRWQGSVGARHYQILRKEDTTDGSWEVIEYYAREDIRPYFTGYIDESARLGATYRYKLRAVNESGVSADSEISSQLTVSRKLLVDHPSNSSKSLLCEGVHFEKGSDRDYKELRSRMVGKAGSEVLYRTEGTIAKIIVYGFSNDKTPDLSLEVSSDGEKFEKAEFKFEEFSLGDLLYDYKVPKKYTIEKLENRSSYLKIKFMDEAYIGRIEIEFE